MASSLQDITRCHSELVPPLRIPPAALIIGGNRHTTWHAIHRSTKILYMQTAGWFDSICRNIITLMCSNPNWLRINLSKTKTITTYCVHGWRRIITSDKQASKFVEIDFFIHSRQLWPDIQRSVHKGSTTATTSHSCKWHCLSRRNQAKTPSY